MKPLVLNAEAIEKLIDLDRLRNHVKRALVRTSRGEIQNSPRSVFPLSKDAAFGLMLAIDTQSGLYTYKTVGVFPKNPVLHAIDAHQGLVVLNEMPSGTPLTILDASRVTALRTAAASAVATDALSARDAGVLAVLGSGVQAFEHVRSILRIRKFKSVRIYSRTKKNSVRLANRLANTFGLNAESFSDPVEAIENADVISSCTSSTEYLFSTDDVKAGAHINAIGACRPGMREVRLTNRAKIYFDSEAHCREEATEVIEANLERTSELGHALADGVLRTSDDITVFKSVGIAALDLACAQAVLEMHHGIKNTTAHLAL